MLRTLARASVTLAAPAAYFLHTNSSLRHTGGHSGRVSCMEGSQGDQESLRDEDVSFKNTVIFSGTRSKHLTEQICNHLKVDEGKAIVKSFSDGEVMPRIDESVRGKHVYIVQTCATPINVSIMELLLYVGAAKRSGASKIIAVIPYFGYREHKRSLPISTTLHSRFLWNFAGDFAKMLHTVGVDKIISVDVQRPGQGHEACFYDTDLSIETISATNALVQYFAKDVGLKSPVVIVSPNTEFVKKAQKFQKKLKTESGLDVDYAAFMYDPPDEMKSVTNYADYSELLGNVKDADVVIVEDLVNTAAELSILCKRLMKEGARRVFVSGNHGLFTGNSMELIDLSPIEKVVVTDTIPLAHNQSKKVVQVPIADLIARVIHAETKGFQSPTADDDDEDEYEIEAQ